MSNFSAPHTPVFGAHTGNKLRAVSSILSASGELRKRAEAHIDSDAFTIHWDGVYAVSQNSSELAAVVWAHAVWCDDLWVTSEHLACPDPFSLAANMNMSAKRAVVCALRELWGLEE